MTAPLRRVGILGGTFDPIHMGHLVVAEVARQQLGLESVVFAPAADPPHKPGAPITEPAHRLAMIELAIAGNPSFAVTRIDLERPGPHYTVDLIRLVAEQMVPRPEVHFVMGADSLVDLPDWHRPDLILRRAILAVANREGFVPDIAELEGKVPGVGSRIRTLHAPTIGISATDLRERVSAGLSIRYQVPEVVQRYVQDHELYRA